jgi:hypothetical protein
MVSVRGFVDVAMVVRGYSPQMMFLLIVDLMSSPRNVQEV